MNPNQKRIVIALAGVTLLVFVAVLIASAGGSGDESVAAETTSIIAPVTSSTTEPTTTTTTSSATSTSSTSTTTTTTSTTTTTTTTTTTALSPLTLRGDGLGLIAFGDEAEAAATAIAAWLGPPDEDSGWIPSFSGFGTCPGEQVRGLRWATLWVLMTDGGTPWRNDGVRHFFSYLNSVFYDDTQSLGLLTEAGIALGDPVASLRATYGGGVQITFDELTDGFIYNIDVAAPGHLGGGVTGDQDDDLITAIDGGVGCGE